MSAAAQSRPDWFSFWKGAALVVASFLVLQTVVVVLHEHAHSTTAWLLGYTRTPFTVVWGNPITVTGWDEGVPYDRLFPHGGVPAEAAIGAAPLLMHALFVAVSLHLLLRPSAQRRPAAFVVLYCFAAINLAELVAYLVDRPFISTGDTGRFRAGLAISPYILFVGGGLGLLAALYVFARQVGARLQDVLRGCETARWALVLAAGFLIFGWDSGLRMVFLFPDPQWAMGLTGLPALIGWIAANALGASTKHGTPSGPEGLALLQAGASD